MNELTTIGRAEVISLPDLDLQEVPAKIDTGADSSAVWATNIYVDEAGLLHYTLFGQDSEFHTGKDLTTTDYTVSQVRSSSGHTQVRYRTHLTLRLGGKRISVMCNLSDRAQNEYPILIGRRTLNGKFLVDATRHEHHGTTRQITKELRKELQENPYEFYKKYHDSSTIEKKEES